MIRKWELQKNAPSKPQARMACEQAGTASASVTREKDMGLISRTQRPGKSYSHAGKPSKRLRALEKERQIQSEQESQVRAKATSCW